jgi:AAHS family 4-hydroxybenzoate transporter-like MFS transporter
MNNQRNVTEIIDQQSIGWFQIRVVVLGILTLFWDGYDTQAIAFIAPALKNAWHLHADALGLVFSTGVVGLGLGGLLIGPFGDKLGRTRILILAMVCTGILSLLTAWATDIRQLLVLRFLIGISLGTVMPICIVLTNEYAPHRHRAAMVTVTICGYAIGAASGGFIASHLVPALGWESVFEVGAAATLVLTAGLFFWMPESIRFLALRPGSAPAIIAILHRINPALSFPADVHFTTTVSHEADTTPLLDKIRELFSPHYRAVTVLLWFSLCMDDIVLNFLHYWLPNLVMDIGLSGPVALRAATALQFGGLLGTITLGLLADRFGYYRILTACFAVGGVAIIGAGLVGPALLGLIVAIFFAGVGTIGCNLILGALAATLYPTRIRSTGSGWAVGAARLLSMVGPLLGGFVIALRWSLQDICVIVSIPMFLGAISVLAMAVAGRKARADGGTRKTAVGAA